MVSGRASLSYGDAARRGPRREDGGELGGGGGGGGGDIGMLKIRILTMLRSDGWQLQEFVNVKRKPGWIGTHPGATVTFHLTTPAPAPPEHGPDGGPGAGSRQPRRRRQEAAGILHVTYLESLLDQWEGRLASNKRKVRGSIPSLGRLLSIPRGRAVVKQWTGCRMRPGIFSLTVLRSRGHTDTDQP